ncbi:PREDICTED: choline-phosphate cytidylyltransferase A isoform X6 [Nicrophorus vespilloides]|uniref:choline-phosphate cytidylyltransferase n=1 Tax=Nicrophorus vespilloides TaxID=110193 RepID=A0ABM1M273_NICVS|nr:PREDICTED: choline-phosphate cytidylyltransferase A isoform X6 [Nicrophorus vespilloides]
MIIKESFCDAALFSEDEGARKNLEQCDYSIKITKEMAERGESPRPIRVYADGAFDLFHQGHARILLQAKNCFPNVYLIVGVCSDKTLHRLKGRTVMDEEERYNAVRHCRYVDEVLRDAPWEHSEAFIAAHKIDFVAHDDIPYPSEDTEDIYAPLKKKGMFIATQRTEGVSTSDIVARIVRHYDVYARRNLARGYSAKELNISYLREKKFKFQNKMESLKDKSKELLGSIGERKDDIINKWEEKSKEFIDNFLMLFGRNRNKLKSILTGSRSRIMNAITPPGSPSRSYDDEDDDSDNEIIIEPPSKIRLT